MLGFIATFFSPSKELIDHVPCSETQQLLFFKLTGQLLVTHN
jgi:hypothetical protein